jgi:hypothetical protein
MNRERTKEAIKVMQAYVDGEDIEYCLSRHSGWTRVSSPSWNWYERPYRIAPKKEKDTKRYSLLLKTKVKTLGDCCDMCEQIEVTGRMMALFKKSDGFFRTPMVGDITTICEPGIKAVELTDEVKAALEAAGIEYGE